MHSWTEEISVDDARKAFLLTRQLKLLPNEQKWFAMHDLGLTQSKFSELKNAFPRSALHSVAIKANPVVPLLRELVKQGAGLEAASFEEVQIALRSDCPESKIVFDSPAKTLDELTQCLKLGVTINVDNFEELNRVAGLVAVHPVNSLIGIRINPLIGQGDIEITSVSGKESKFGVFISQEEDILSKFNEYPWLKMLHVHVGSQGYSLDLMVKGIHAVYELAETINSKLGKRQIETIDIGGGLSARYTDKDAASTPEELSAALKLSCPGLFDGRYNMITEYGRSLLASCGCTFSRVEYVKKINQKRAAVVHFGADYMMRPVYQPAHWKHRYELFDADMQYKQKNSSHDAMLFGPLCFNGDVLDRQVDLNDVQVGDWLLARDTGAYTLSMWSRHCNRVLPPLVGYDLSAGDVRLLFRGETPEDVASFWDRC